MRTHSANVAERLKDAAATAAGRSRCRICVIGGGPAGAVAAKRLVEMGHGAWLLELASFPRSRVGESLVPGVIPLLDELGVREAVESAGFIEAGAPHVLWAGYVDRQGPEAPDSGLLVNRGQFDTLLLDAAKAAGVQVLQPARAGSPYRHAGAWRIPVTHADGRSNFEADFIVDASGSASLLPGRKHRLSPATLALFAYWTDVPLTGSCARIEAVSAAWFWGAPLPDGLFNATVFIDPTSIAGLRASELRDRYCELLAQSTLLRPCLDGRLGSVIHACSAATRIVQPVASTDFIKAGDAAFLLDPLSSQGVQRAIVSSLQAAIVVNTLLRRPSDASTALAFYEARQIETIDADLRVGREIYRRQAEASGTPFWHRYVSDVVSDVPAPSPPVRIAAPNSSQVVMLAPAAFVAPAPAIRDEFVETLPALHHPRLERAVAFFGNTPITALLRALATPVPISTLYCKWTKLMSASRAMEALAWCWDNGIMVPEAGIPDDAERLPQIQHSGSLRDARVTRLGSSQQRYVRRPRLNF